MSRAEQLAAPIPSLHGRTQRARAGLSGLLPHIATLRRSSERVPPDWNGAIDAAVYAKRQGHYAASARMIIDTTVYEGVMHTGALASM